MHKFKLMVMMSLSVVAGCRTIMNAHEKQRELSPYGEVDNSTNANEEVKKVNLAGYSLDQLVDFALTNRPSVVIANLAVEDARLALKAIDSNAPLLSTTPWNALQLSANINYSASSEADYRPRLETEGGATGGLSLQILLYDFGRNQSEAGAQAERVIAAEMDALRESYNVFNEVTTAYFKLLESDALLENAQSNVVEYVVHLQQAEERLAAGEALKLDVTRAKLDLSKAYESTLVASNQVSIAGVTLMKALGIDALHGNRDEVYPARGLMLDTVMRGFADTDYDVNEIYLAALESSPAVNLARARFRAASREVDRAIADMMPNVTANVGLNWMDPLWAWNWGVGAVQSLFQGFRKTTAVDRAVLALEAAAMEVQEAEHQLSLDVETAIANRDDAKKILETSYISIARAMENLDLVKERLYDGDANRVDYTVATVDLVSQISYAVSAFYNGQQSEAKLFSIIGLMPTYQEEEVKAK